MQMTETKVCTKCSESKQLSDFSKSKRSKDGLEHACRDCRSLKNRAYYSSNKEKVLAECKAYRENNKDKESARKKAYYEANLDKVLADMKAWNGANPDHKAALGGKGHAIRRGGSTSEIYDLELCIPFYAESRRLSKETGVAHHVDHIIPITKGGLHCQTNLQVLTAEENFQKGDSV